MFRVGRRVGGRFLGRTRVVGFEDKGRVGGRICSCRFVVRGERRRGV